MDLRGLQSRVWDRIRGLSPRQVLFVGYVLFLLYGFPGYMSSDSVTQLGEARTGVFSDGNPPLMAVEWMFFDRIVSGPLLMLLQQSLLFLGGLYFIFKRYVSPKAAAWTAIGVFLFPPVMTCVAVIWKDTQMAAFLVAGVAGMLQEKRNHRLIGLAFMLAACLMRHNALAAAAPLVALIFEWKNPIRWYKRVGIFLLAAVLAFGALLGASKLIAKNHVRLTPVFYDILGMVAYGDEKDDDKLKEILKGTPLAVDHDIQAHARHTFDMRGLSRVVYGEDRLFDYPKDEAEWDALYRSWETLIKRDPGSYFASHWVQFERVLGVEEVPRAPVYDLFIESPSLRPAAQHDSSPSRIQQYSRVVLYWAANNTPLFRPWIYAVIGLLLVALFGRDRITWALVISGLLYELSFLPAFAEPDYRYSHWMITGTVIAAVLTFIQRRQRCQSRNEPEARSA